MFSLFIALAAASPAPIDAAAIASESRIRFAEPVRLAASGSFIRTESPGYAAPAVHDVDGDGIDDLVVGQFNDGKLKLYRGKADGTYSEGEWLKADGETAVVPGVW